MTSILQADKFESDKTLRQFYKLVSLLIKLFQKNDNNIILSLCNLIDRFILFVQISFLIISMQHVARIIEIKILDESARSITYLRRNGRG